MPTAAIGPRRRAAPAPDGLWRRSSPKAVNPCRFVRIAGWHGRGTHFNWKKRAFLRSYRARHSYSVSSEVAYERSYLTTRRARNFAAYLTSIPGLPGTPPCPNLLALSFDAAAAGPAAGA